MGKKIPTKITQPIFDKKPSTYFWGYYMSFSHFPMSFPIFCQTFGLFNFFLILLLLLLLSPKPLELPQFSTSPLFFFYILYIYYFYSTSDLFLSIKYIQDSFYNHSSHKLLIHSKINTIEIY